MKNNFILLLFILFLIALSGSCSTSGEPKAYEPGEGWNLAWADEFNDGVFDTDIWDRQVWLRPPNGQWEKYTGKESTAYEADGFMILETAQEGSDHGLGRYSSARVISNPGGYRGKSGTTGKTFLYGKIAARIKLPSGKGLWPAFWLLGDNIDETGGDTKWPESGEIDIVETGSKLSEDKYFGHATAGQAIHFSNAAGSWQYRHGSTTLRRGVYSDDFHVFEIEWDSEQIVWKIDGETVHMEDITAPYLSEFHKEFYVLFNIAVGGNFTYRPDDSTGFPQYMYIDWIRHYVKE